MKDKLMKLKPTLTLKYIEYTDKDLNRILDSLNKNDKYIMCDFIHLLYNQVDLGQFDFDRAWHKKYKLLYESREQLLKSINSFEESTSFNPHQIIKSGE